MKRLFIDENEHTLAGKPVADQTGDVSEDESYGKQLKWFISNLEIINSNCREESQGKGPITQGSRPVENE